MARTIFLWTCWRKRDRMGDIDCLVVGGSVVVLCRYREGGRSDIGAKAVVAGESREAGRRGWTQVGPQPSRHFDSSEEGAITSAALSLRNRGLHNPHQSFLIFVVQRSVEVQPWEKGRRRSTGIWGSRNKMHVLSYHRAYRRLYCRGFSIFLDSRGASPSLNERQPMPSFH